MTRYKPDDIDLLLPSFAPVVRQLLERLRARGYDPVPRDTLRTPEEALRNAAKGTGIVDSIHCYGAAVDVICGAHGWDCRERGCSFFDDLGVEAEALGLTWGGRWRRGKKGPDWPHVQAIRVRDQNALRALKTADERDAFVRSRLRAPVHRVR